MCDKNTSHIHQCWTQFVYEMYLAAAWDYLKNDTWHSVETNWPSELALERLEQIVVRTTPSLVWRPSIYYFQYNCRPTVTVSLSQTWPPHPNNRKV